MTQYTSVLKPSGTTYTAVNAAGREQFDDPNVLFDDPGVFFDGINLNQYTNIPKPSLPVASVIVDSYAVSNYSNSNAVINSVGNPGIIKQGNTFSVASAFIPDRMEFYLSKTGSPTGMAYGRIYTLTSSNLPSSLIASSGPTSMASIPSAIGLVSFPFISSTIVPAGRYAAIYDPENSGANDYSNMGQDTTSPTHGGQRVFMTKASVWTASSPVDTIFYVYGTPSNYTKIFKP